MRNGYDYEGATNKDVIENVIQFFPWPIYWTVRRAGEQNGNGTVTGMGMGTIAIAETETEAKVEAEGA